MDAPHLLEIAADDAASPESLSLKADLRPAVWRALDRLPDDLRTTVILQVYQGLKYREIASIMEVPIGTVMSRLHRGRRILKKELADTVLEST